MQGQSAHIKAKERDKKERQGRRAKEQKGIKTQRAKPPTPTRGIAALQMKKETGHEPPTQLPWTL